MRTTIYEAVVLVILVMIVFLQSWRTAIVPIVAIPVSLIGTFAVMAALGFSINNLSLFGLVLAIGIVVDDAIVVVENVERNLRAGLSPREAAHRTIDEVAGPIIATFLVLAAVFVPAAFIPGISGPVLPAVRGHDRGLHRDLDLGLALAQPGALRACSSSPTRRTRSVARLCS